MRFNFYATLQQKIAPIFFCQFYAKLLVSFLPGTDSKRVSVFCCLQNAGFLCALLKSHSANVKQSKATAAPEILAFFTCLFLPACPLHLTSCKLGFLLQVLFSFIFYSSSLASQQRHFRFVGTARADLISNEISIRLQQVGNDANEKESEERTCWYLERKQAEQHISICFLDEDIFDWS